MSTSHISIYLEFDYKSICSSDSYIILSESEVVDTALPAALTPPSPDYVSASPDYVSASDKETKPFKAPASPDYTPRSDIKTEPFKENPQEDSLEESSEEVP
ncbi:hypothetical protein Tco_1187241 [Tanacetum coccineum]